MKDRIKRLRDRFQDFEIDSLLVFSQVNIRYLSGFTGSSGILLISPQRCFLVTDFRYKQQGSLQALDCEIIIAQDGLIRALGKLPIDSFGKRMGFESEYTSFKQYTELKESLPSVSLIPVQNLVEDLSVIKEDGEIRCIKRAAEISDRVFEEAVAFIKPGVTERDVAAEIDYAIRRAGGEKASFDTIVASGPRSSMPHATTSDRVIQEGDLVVLDFGARYEGYASDLSRTLVVGTPTERQGQLYKIVQKAQETAIQEAREGITCSQLDGVARRIIEDAGHGADFGHPLGHGVGLNVHDPPRVSWRDGVVLKAGMVITIEPGIYIPDWGGIRIEDVIVIREDGCENLTTAKKGLTPGAL
ncbi:MAG TPA: aminopeptidase P family protein [Candidatus Latescibacteria bacterium]|nr:aminopeptidase P family protein [Candidatus Latescibacterota bacterium]